MDRIKFVTNRLPIPSVQWCPGTPLFPIYIYFFFPNVHSLLWNFQNCCRVSWVLLNLALSDHWGLIYTDFISFRFSLPLLLSSAIIQLFHYIFFFLLIIINFLLSPKFPVTSRIWFMCGSLSSIALPFCNFLFKQIPQIFP